MYITSIYMYSIYAKHRNYFSSGSQLSTVNRTTHSKNKVTTNCLPLFSLTDTHWKFLQWTLLYWQWFSLQNVVMFTVKISECHYLKSSEYLRNFFYRCRGLGHSTRYFTLVWITSGFLIVFSKKNHNFHKMQIFMMKFSINFLNFH